MEERGEYVGVLDCNREFGEDVLVAQVALLETVARSAT